MSVIDVTMDFTFTLWPDAVHPKSSYTSWASKVKPGQNTKWLHHQATVWWQNDKNWVKKAVGKQFYWQVQKSKRQIIKIIVLLHTKLTINQLYYISFGVTDCSESSVYLLIYCSSAGESKSDISSWRNQAYLSAMQDGCPPMGYSIPPHREADKTWGDIKRFLYTSHLV